MVPYLNNVTSNRRNAVILLHNFPEIPFRNMSRISFHIVILKQLAYNRLYQNFFMEAAEYTEMEQTYEKTPADI